MCPQSIKTASRAWNCDQHHHHYGPCAAVPPSSVIQWLSKPKERERKTTTTNTGNEESVEGLFSDFFLFFFSFSFSARFYQVKSLSTLSTVKSSARVTVLHVQCCTVSIRHETRCTVLHQHNAILFYFLGFTILLYSYNDTFHT